MFTFAMRLLADFVLLMLMPPAFFKRARLLSMLNLHCRHAFTYPPVYLISLSFHYL